VPGAWCRESFCGDPGGKRPIYVANRCSNELPRVSTPRHSHQTDETLLPFDLPAVRRKKLTVDFEGGNQSANGGALLLREAERDVGVCWRLAETMPDRRDPDHIQHQMVEMVTARVTASPAATRMRSTTTIFGRIR
jgi:hypothetical protein